MFSAAPKYNFSQKFALAILATYALDFVMGGKLTELFSLNIAVLIENMELWRAFTHPLSRGPLESIILFGITFTVFAPRLEFIIKGAIFPLILFLLSFLLGAVLTLAFWDNPQNFTGMAGISFFILTMFLFLNYDKRIVIFNSKPVKSFILVTLTVLGWLLAISTRAFAFGFEGFFLEGAQAGFGIAIGGLFYVQLYFMKKSREKKKKDVELSMPSREELSMALISQQESRHFGESAKEEPFHTELDGRPNEELLNEILDKINESGKSSLTPGEIKFLEDYSKLL